MIKSIKIMALGLMLTATAVQAQTAKTKPKTAKSPVQSSKNAEKSMTPTTKLDKVSYAIGANIAMNLKSQGIEINPEMMASAIKDVLGGGKLALTESQMMETLKSFEQEMQAKMQGEASKAGEANRKAGEAFLAENKSKEGVVALPSGLQYKILKEGNGEKPKATDRVKTHYHGTLLDGSVFDSSVERGEPAVFGVNQVIAGWTEALQLMPVGSKWRLYIPSDLAYGDRGAGPKIGPGSTLIFDVELLSIEK